MIPNRISRQVEDYIAYKQALGYQIKIESQELRRFAAYTESVEHSGSLTVEIAFQWAALKPEYSRWYKARRMETIRTFAKYICILDPSAQLPPKGMFGQCHGRTAPYILSAAEIGLLMESAAKLHAPDGLRRITIPAAIGLLWTTGIRPNEACHLTDEDVDLENSRMTIRETKFSKTRTLPLHETTVSALRIYVKERNHLQKGEGCRSFFRMTGNRNLELRNFEYAWTTIRDQLLIDQTEWNRRPPRLYDIRHSFACHTLLRWLNSGVDVNHKILYLSTYLGHVKVSDTYWYLTGTPELMQIASEHFERFYSMGGNQGEK